MSLVVVLFAAAAVADVSGRWMDDDALKRSFGGATIAGVYFDGRTFREQYRPDGSLIYEEPIRKRGGTWRVVVGTFCTIYPEGEPGGCFRVQRASANCFRFYFAARSIAGAEGGATDALAYTAEAWRTDAASTCNEVPTS
ncbi:MAG: hypothetical protein AAGJ53_08070 [Pseudomonadota bacterium]